MNKVKKMGLCTIQYEGHYITKNMWRCTVCNRVFKLRYKAQGCNHEDSWGRYGRGQPALLAPFEPDRNLGRKGLVLIPGKIDGFVSGIVFGRV